MSLVLELTAEMEATLTTEAAQLGLPVAEYALRLIAAGRAQQPGLQTGAELVQYWNAAGLVGTRPDINDSQAHAQALRKQAEMRSRL
jgi:hypothetical protein